MFSFLNKKNGSENITIKELNNRILCLNKAITIYEGIVDKNIVNLVRESVISPAIKFKFKVEALKKGEDIISKGEVIINKRNSLNDEILLKERQGKDVSKEREQLKAFDWIINEVKNED